jgi:hypothetical protein
VSPSLIVSFVVFVAALSWSFSLISPSLGVIFVTRCLVRCSSQRCCCLRRYVTVACRSIVVIFVAMSPSLHHRCLRVAVLSLSLLLVVFESSATLLVVASFRSCSDITLWKQIYYSRCGLLSHVDRNDDSLDAKDLNFSMKSCCVAGCC